MNGFDLYAMAAVPAYKRIGGLWCRLKGHNCGGIGRSSVFVKGAKGDYSACYVCRELLYTYPTGPCEADGEPTVEQKADCAATIKAALAGSVRK